MGRRPDVDGRYSSFNGAVRVDTQCLHQARLGSRQQFREHNKVRAACDADPQRCVHVLADGMAARRQPDLPLARKEHVPGFVLLMLIRLLAVGAALSIGSGFAAGAGEAVVAAGAAVFGPSVRLEVPAAEGPQPFFAALRST